MVGKIDAKSLSGQAAASLLKDAYDIAPYSNDIRAALLEALIAKFNYLAHEWPSAGILYAPHEPWHEQYWNLMQEIRLARTIDLTQKYADILEDFEQKVFNDRTRQPG